MESGAGSSREREERHDCEFCFEDLQTLLAAQRAIASSLEPESVVQLTADEARRITSAEMSAVYLLNQKNRLEICAVSGGMRKSLLGHTVSATESLAGRAMQSAKPFLLEDTHDFSDVYSPIYERFKARAILIVPLSIKNAAGAILVANRTPGGLGIEEQNLLALMSEGAAVAFENARRYVSAQQSAARQERRRLSNKLQGAVSQTLFSASLIADVLPRLWDRDPQEGRNRMEELRQITRGALVEVRSLMNDDS